MNNMPGIGFYEEYHPRLKFRNEMNIKDVYYKYRNGDSITDIELKFAINEFSNLEEQLKELGERFHFAWREIFDVKSSLTYMQKARKQK